jgi:hypothetical protein
LHLYAERIQGDEDGGRRRERRMIEEQPSMVVVTVMRSSSGVSGKNGGRRQLREEGEETCRVERGVHCGYLGRRGGWLVVALATCGGDGGRQTGGGWNSWERRKKRENCLGKTKTEGGLSRPTLDPIFLMLRP